MIGVLRRRMKYRAISKEFVGEDAP